MNWSVTAGWRPANSTSIAPRIRGQHAREQRVVVGVNLEQRLRTQQERRVSRQAQRRALGWRGGSVGRAKRVPMPGRRISRSV